MDPRTLRRRWRSDYTPQALLTNLTNMVSMLLRSSSRLLMVTRAAFQFFISLHLKCALVSLLCLPVSRSQVSSHQQEVLMENVTRMSERSQLLQQSLGEAATDADLLENIWKLENLFQNHSDWMQKLEILVKVWRWVYWYDHHQSGSHLSFSVCNIWPDLWFLHWLRLNKLPIDMFVKLNTRGTIKVI